MADVENKITLEDILVKGRLAKDEDKRPAGLEQLRELISQINNTEDNQIKHVGPFMSHRIQQIDTALSEQLDVIIHDPIFQKLEGSWRGLHYLVNKSHTSSTLKLRLMNISKPELLQDLEKAVEFDQSQLFKKVYEEEYGTFGGAPYSCLVGDYEFGSHPLDMALIRKIAQVASAAHTPFISGAAPSLFNLESFSDLGVPRDLARTFESTELLKWRSFRESEDSRYVALTLPHVLTRLPYGPDTNPVEDLNYTEKVEGTDNSKFCWGNASYVLGERITNAAFLYNWTTAIRGVEGGGLVEDLPTYTFKTTDGDVALKCPTEVAITDRREKELSDLGFISLCHCKGSDYAAFFGGQTAQRPKKFSTADANANAQLSARLTYMLAASRFAHYIKAIIRDKIGSFLSKDDVANYLNKWIANYVLLSDEATQSTKARFPLREARIDVFDIPGKPGSYRATVFLRPHFQLEELTASIRLVATLPAPAA
ncbi:MAG: type VI secretion system contractile sheath large subunit [Alphaproteobacteria bacterium]|nr:MAG: type VI secretion system contractile sheath large subunit [Alphaproteobacteria bacterium]